MAYQSLDRQSSVYGFALNQLCWQILNSPIDSIRNETEGLDVYIEIFPTVDGNVQDFDSGRNFNSNTEVIQIIYAIKKKSNPEC